MRLAIVIGVALVGCGGASGSPDADPDQPDADPGGRCEDRDLYSLFRASPSQDVSGRFGSQIGGWVNTGRAPEIVTPTDTAGACRFVAAQPALCDPACAGGDVCDVHGACVPYPESITAGTVTITGTNPTITLEPQLGSYYNTMPYPGLYAPGDALTLDVEGDTATGAEPIHLTTVGIPALALPTDHLTATEHQDFVIAWTAVTGLPGTEIVVELHNDHHAGPQYIECTTDAALGSVTVPAALLDELIVAGETGIGTYIESAWIEQRHRGHVISSRGCAAFDADSDHFLTIDTVRSP